MMCIAVLERIAFYGIRTMLVLFVIKQFMYEDAAAFYLNTTLMALSFILSIFGGWVADKYTSQHPMMTWGLMLNIAGCIMLLGDTHVFFLMGVSFVFVGASLFRPSMMSLVGHLADQLKMVKSITFTLFYCIFNLGGFIGIFGCAAMGEYLGWHYAFWIALSVNLIALIILFSSRNFIQNLQTQSYPFHKIMKGMAFSLILLPIVLISVQFSAQVMNTLPYFFAIFILFLFIYSYRTKDLGITWFYYAMMGIMINLIFFSIYEQQSNSLVLFIERNIDRSVSIPFLNIDLMPIILFQAIDPLYNIIFGGLIAWVWFKLDQQLKSPSHFVKCSIGLICLGIGFLIILFLKPTAEDGIMPMTTLFIATIFIVAGELLVLPITMSYFSNIAPKNMHSFSMGIWSLSLGFSEFLAVKFASFTTSDAICYIDNPILRMNLYCDCFKIYGLIPIGAGILVMMMTYITRKWFRIPSL